MAYMEAAHLDCMKNFLLTTPIGDNLMAIRAEQRGACTLLTKVKYTGLVNGIDICVAVSYFCTHIGGHQPALCWIAGFEFDPNAPDNNAMYTNADLVYKLRVERQCQRVLL